MTVVHETSAGGFESATPLDVFRSVLAYEEAYWPYPTELPISAELFDGDATYADRHRFVEGQGTEQGTYAMLGMVSIADGVDVDELARFYERRAKGVRAKDHETVVALFMEGGYLAIAVSRMALRGITVMHMSGKYKWHDQDEALDHAIAGAGIYPETVDRNNIRQHSGGVKGSNESAAAAARGDWNGWKGGGTPSNALKIPGLLT